MCGVTSLLVELNLCFKSMFGEKKSILTSSLVEESVIILSLQSVFQLVLRILKLG